jgi:hypothetical protein
VAFPTDRIELGPHAYGRRPATYGVCFHTTEFADSSMAQALKCIRDQSPGGSLFAKGGSYNFILTNEGPVLSVPFLEASGGLTINHTPPPAGHWAPNRYPWLAQMLRTAAMDDPNNYLLQIAISGKTARLLSDPAIKRIVDDAARLLIWAERQPEMRDNLVVMGHLNWQTNRSDPGQGFIDRVMARYAAIVAPPSTGRAGPEAPGEAPSTPPPPRPRTREARLAAEVLRLRAKHRDRARAWGAATKQKQSTDGQPQKRESRLAAEALYLRRVDHGSDAVTPKHS